MAPAHGQDCTGNPNALGTSRVLAVESGEYGGFGVMQYPETVPLNGTSSRANAGVVAKNTAARQARSGGMRSGRIAVLG